MIGPISHKWRGYGPPGTNLRPQGLDFNFRGIVNSAALRLVTRTAQKETM